MKKWNAKDKKKASDFSEAFSWCELGSNQRHKDFQSFALPTELSHLFIVCFTKRSLGWGVQMYFLFLTHQIFLTTISPNNAKYLIFCKKNLNRKNIFFLKQN